MTWTVWAAIVIVILTVAALIKRYETRLVLLASGFLMTCLSLDPMQGLNAFAKSMRQLPAFFYSLPRGSLKTATVA